MDTLQYLADRAEIEQVYYLYCEAIDTKQFDRLVGVFTEDTVGDYRAVPGKLLIEDRAALLKNMWNNLGPGSFCGQTHHNVTNIRLRVDGDRAESWAHYYAVHEGALDYAGQLYVMWGEYHDQWARTPEGWRVKVRGYDPMISRGPREITTRRVD
jgi:ketosteroid isomerase-like protein